MSPHATQDTPRGAGGELLPLLRGDSTLVAIANEHEPLEEPEPVVGREFRKLLALVYPVVRSRLLSDERHPRPFALTLLDRVQQRWRRPRSSSCRR